MSSDLLTWRHFWEVSLCFSMSFCWAVNCDCWVDTCLRSSSFCCRKREKLSTVCLLLIKSQSSMPLSSVVFIISTRFTRSKSSMRLSLCSPELWTSTSVWTALSFMLYWYSDRWGGYPILSELLRLPGEGTVYPYRTKTKHCHQCTPIEKTHKNNYFYKTHKKQSFLQKKAQKNALLKQTLEIISSYIEKT